VKSEMVSSMRVHSRTYFAVRVEHGGEQGHGGRASLHQPQNTSVQRYKSTRITTEAHCCTLSSHAHCTFVRPQTALPRLRLGPQIAHGDPRLSGPLYKADCKTTDPPYKADCKTTDPTYKADCKPQIPLTKLELEAADSDSDDGGCVHLVPPRPSPSPDRPSPPA